MAEQGLISRTCYEIVTDESVSGSRDSVAVVKSQSLSSYRDLSAYVLLGEPGAGKTAEFEQECKTLGDCAELVSARLFAKADIASHPEWRNKVLFIDGLDETRSVGRDATTALDEIQSRLDALGRPRFRISCRAADWLGPVDRRPLTEVAPDGKVTTLRLEPLDRSDVRKYLQNLKSQIPVGDPDDFLLQAESLGLGSMLDNPLTLQLLLKSTENDSWPSTRREAFERACRVLAQEHNPEHPASAVIHPPEPILDAAGRLFAVQLLAVKDGYSLASVDSDAEFISVYEHLASFAAETQQHDLEPREVLATKLFVPNGDQCLVPKHRQIAEYLAARHIASLIEARTVSLSRIHSAITSRIDERVVTDLRGLAAWIGTHYIPARRMLTEADPVGIAMYGDISAWSDADRLELLDCLAAQARPEDLWGTTWFEASEHRYRHATGWSFRGLCMPDMLSHIGEMLDADRRSEIPDHVRELLLLALSEAQDDWLPDLSSLVSSVRQLALGATTQPDVRLAALFAYARIEPSESERTATLLEALEAVGYRRHSDPDDRIGGALLRLLYPMAISPRQVWSYASLMHLGPAIGEGWMFWRHVLCDSTPADQLANLLDGFAEDAKRLWPILSSAYADELPWRLLIRAVREIGHEMAPERLYCWVAAIGIHSRLHSTSVGAQAGLLEWLAENAPISQKLISIWIVRSANDDTNLDERFFLGDLLLRSQALNFVEWCAQQARIRATDDWDAACAFVEAPLRHRYALGASRDSVIEQLASALAGSPPLLRHLDEYIQPSALKPNEQEADRRQRHEIDEIRADHESEQQKRQADWSEYLHDSLDDLSSNTFAAQNLHTLALAYFGHLPEVRNDASPRERIADLIGDDAEILDAVIGALRDALFRPDVPSAQRTAELTANSQLDWLAYPVLAGLEIRETEGIIQPSCLPEDLRCSAVAIYATTVLNQTERPRWPVGMLRDDPKLVLDVCHRCAVAELKKGATHLSTLNWLAGIDGLEDDLRDFRLRLLKSMSVRLPIAQLPILDSLVHLVASHPCSAPLGELVTSKLQATSMTDSQRVRWLTLDAIMRGGDALSAFEEFIDANQKRSQHLAEFLRAEFRGGRGFVGRLLSAEPASTLCALIGIVGRSFPPREWESSAAKFIGVSDTMSHLVSDWINELGSHPTAEAGVSLDALVADDRLSAWRENLRFMQDRQQRLHRDASHQPMNVTKVLNLLHNGPPANVADLHALLCEHLRDMRDYLRGDNSDPWRAFWEDERAQSPTQPRHEETCRDALLTAFRSKLPEGVDAQPEGQYAAGRRADIRVSYGGFNVPVEIKKNSHPDLWTAIERQLVAKYTIDPETGGYGIYLVLWCGPTIEGYCGRPSDTDRPQTPEELERRLDESLTHELRRRISVVVLDVTKPQG